MDIAEIGGQLLARWGRERLRRWPDRALRGITLPPTSRRLLVDFGLPELWPETERFLTEVPELPRLDAAHPDCRVLAVAVGAEERSPRYCLDEKRDGRILSVFPVRAEAAAGTPNEWSITLVNSRVEYFARFLLLFDQLRATATCWSQRLPDRPSRPELSRYETEVLSRIAKLERAMQETDPEAMADPEGQWPLLVAEFREHTMWDLE